MLLFTFRAPGATGSFSSFTLVHYAAIFDPSQELTYDQLFTGIGNSLLICVITVAVVLLVLLPTMVLVELRYPSMRRAIEFVCLLPITVPTVVLVVGFVPVYQVVAGVFGSVAWTLSFAIGIIVLPYAYRPIQANIAALDLVVLGEAARSLGAGWLSVLGRVILPNLKRGILSACFLTIAVVLGEYTIASFLNQTTFQTALFLLQQTDPYVAAIFAVFALVFAFVLLLVIGRVGSYRRTRRSAS
ncbi:ABC transporter permease subunit [Humibacter ginsenosidimutans]|uniref:ABC transporter permease subunit n=2 Tax=Humibacter ginsenosidimutans TaxID=2599293 RepID=A0A5B8M870_9MICO|nr:ABC transporter permease subunit [Humibacter ginsenosidimutans]